jgi:thioredoxin 1
MRKLQTFCLMAIAILFNACSNGQSQTSPTNLSANDFSTKLKTLPSAPLLDVRTPGEFSKEHLPNAINIDWNGSDFDKQIATLDRSKPVLVYCLSGARSAAAAAKMRGDGFKEVYELQGGIMKWKAASLPLNTGANNGIPGMSYQQFEQLLKTDKAVLVDFYADWCAPCKKMKPYLAEIAKDMADELIVVRINADENPGLCKTLKVSALPVLQLYKKNVLTWSNEGFIEKADLVKKLQ